jgi:hypothetical protein
MHVSLIIAAISAMVSGTILAFASVSETNNNLSVLHASHLSNIPTNEPVNLEHKLGVERAGDAILSTRLIIDKEYVDTAVNCEFCTRIEYSPSQNGEAGIAYRNDNLNLTGYQRIVLFARADTPQEIRFLAIGTKSSPSNSNNIHIFPNENFAFVTKRIALDSDWKKFEINLNKTKLEGVDLPFGFIIADDGSDSKQIFYLKGITFDRKPAQNPLPLVS